MKRDSICCVDDVLSLTCAEPFSNVTDHTAKGAYFGSKGEEELFMGAQEQGADATTDR